MLNLFFKRVSSLAKEPVCAHPEEDAGFDLFSLNATTIAPGERVLIDTGIAFEIPRDYYGDVRDKSGLADSFGLTVLGGIIDSGYRNSVKVILLNTGKQREEIGAGKKIAQIIFTPCPRFRLIEVEELQSSDRGSGGFGSSGA